MAVIRGDDRTVFEVVMTGPLEKELSNLQKHLAAGFGHVIFCVESEEVKHRLKELVCREVSESEDRMEIRLLKEFA